MPTKDNLPNSELREALVALHHSLTWQAELHALGVPISREPAAAAVVATPSSAVEAPQTRPTTAPSPAEPRAPRAAGSIDARPAARPVSLLPTPASLGAPTVAAISATGEPLDQIRADLGDCQRCKLCDTRKNIVYGVGNPTADLMFVGEAPGADEDEQGEPFVGRAGQLLTKMIAAMGLSRRDVYIANVIKCRPPQNRDPEPDEIVACEPFLIRQIRSLQPKVIVTLGRISAHTLLRIQTPITRLRGQWQTYQGVRLMPTYHPAYLLRNPPAKREVWEDLQAVMKELGMGPPGGRDGSAP